MSESWDDVGGDNSKRRSFSREFTNQSRYTDRRQGGDDRRDRGSRPQGRGRRDDYNRYGQQNQNDSYRHQQYNRSSQQQYGRPSQYNSESNYSKPRSFNQSSESDVVLQIPTQRIGKLIGRGGSTVKDLQNRSGCRISIDSDRERETASVKLCGSEDAQQQAKQLIEDLMENDMGPPRAPRGPRTY